MGYEIQVLSKGAYLHLLVTGQNGWQTAAAYLAEVRRLCAETGCPHVLIEENLSGPSLSSVFRVVMTAARNLWPVVKTVAYVDVNPEHDVGLMRYAGNLAFKLGINVHVFTSVEDAEQWIGGETSARRR
jgi:hypothetical protein